MELKPIEIWYWRIRGKGTYITDFLSALNVPFTVNYFDFDKMEEYGKWKMGVFQEYPYVNLPTIRDPNNGNKYLAETNAILQYLAQQYKADAGATSLDEMNELMVLNGLLDDLSMHAVVRHLFSSKTKDELKEKIMSSKQRCGLKLKTLESLLSDNEWVFKNRFTYLDVKLANFTEWLTTMETELDFQYLAESERKTLLAHMNKTTAVDGLQKWRSSDKFFARPFLSLIHI